LEDESVNNIELLKVLHDVLLQAAKGIEAVLDDCDASEPDEAPNAVYRPAHALRDMRARGEMSARSCNCLLRAGFNTIEDVVARVEGLETLKRIRNMGPSSIAEVLRVAHELGLKWRWEE
jgi:DNA-directed RNA polymerase alpha subunit